MQINKKYKNVDNIFTRCCSKFEAMIFTPRVYPLAFFFCPYFYSSAFFFYSMYCDFYTLFFSIGATRTITKHNKQHNQSLAVHFCNLWSRFP